MGVYSPGRSRQEHVLKLILIPEKPFPAGLPSETGRLSIRD